MAAIIRAPAMAAGSRQLRRPGAAPVAAAAAVAPALTGPASASDTPAIPSTTSASAAPAAPSTASASVAHAVPSTARASVVPAALSVAPAPPSIAEQAPQAVQQLERQASALREREQAAQAEQDALAQRREQLAQQEQQLTQQQAELAAREQALQEARQRLRDEAEDIRAEAAQRGHQQGLEQGEREAAAAVATQVERLNTVTQALTQSRRAALDEQQDLLVEIAFTAICRMLGTQAASQAGMESMVRSLIDGTHAPESLVVRVHPLDLPLLQGGALDPRLGFQADAGIELGGCIVDGPRGTLDARLDLQVQHVRETLMQVRRQHTQHEAPV